MEIFREYPYINQKYWLIFTYDMLTNNRYFLIKNKTYRLSCNDMTTLRACKTEKDDDFKGKIGDKMFLRHQPKYLTFGVINLIKYYLSLITSTLLILAKKEEKIVQVCCNKLFCEGSVFYGSLKWRLFQCTSGIHYVNYNRQNSNYNFALTLRILTLFNCQFVKKIT